MHQTVFAREYRDKRTEVHQSGNLAVIDASNFDIGSDQFDTATRFPTGCPVDRCNPDRTVIVDVDRRTGFLGHRADD